MKTSNNDNDMSVLTRTHMLHNIVVAHGAQHLHCPHLCARGMLTSAACTYEVCLKFAKL